MYVPKYHEETDIDAPMPGESESFPAKKAAHDRKRAELYGDGIDIGIVEHGGVVYGKHASPSRGGGAGGGRRRGWGGGGTPPPGGGAAPGGGGGAPGGRRRRRSPPVEGAMRGG
jgi:hypothetical protein